MRIVKLSVDRLCSGLDVHELEIIFVKSIRELTSLFCRFTRRQPIQWQITIAVFVILILPRSSGDAGGGKIFLVRQVSAGIPPKIYTQITSCDRVLPWQPHAILLAIYVIP